MTDVDVLACPVCGQAHAPDVVFYVSAEYQGQHCILLGPFPTHQRAMDMVGVGRERAWKKDYRAPWYGYGTGSARASVPVLPALNTPEETAEWGALYGERIP